MSDLKLTVALTSVNSENMSRHDMLQWVNTMVQGHYKKIEELCSGVAYCQMLELIFPNCINLKRVKLNAKLEHEYLHNLKLFQAAFTRLKLDKTVPIDRLIKARFQDNFEFLQWFKKFFDSQAPGDLENQISAANAPTVKAVKPRGYNKERSPVPPATTNSSSNEAEEEELRGEWQTLTLKMDNTVVERDNYFEKLRQIELLMNNTVDQHQNVHFCKRLGAILYEPKPDQAADGNEGMY